MLDIKPRVNILASKLTEIRDIPNAQRLSIFGPGTILGEEDFLKREKHSCTLKCNSMSGKLFKITADLFDIIRSNQPEVI